METTVGWVTAVALVSATTAATVSAVAVRSRRAWGVGVFAALAAGWAATFGLRVLASPPAAGRIWLRIGGVVVVPILPTVAVVLLREAGSLSRRMRVVIAGETTLAAVLAWFDPADLYWREVGTTTIGGSRLVAAEAGVGYLAHVTFGLLLAVGAGILTTGPTRRLRPIVIAAVVTPPVVATGAFTTGITPVDTTPVWLGLLTPLVAFAARRDPIAAVADPVVAVDTDGLLVAANPAARDAFDISASAVGDPAGEKSALPIPDLLAIEQREVIAVGDREYEARVTRQDEYRVYALRDVTRRRRMERRFRTYVEQADDVLIVIDEDGAVEYVSNAVERTLGHDPDHLVGQSVLKLIHPEDRPDLTDVFRTTVANTRSASGPARRGASSGRDRVSEDGSTSAAPSGVSAQSPEPTRHGEPARSTDTPQPAEPPDASQNRSGETRRTPTEAGRDESARETTRERFRVAHGDGGWRTVEAVVAVGDGVTGTRLLVNLRDVTAQRQYEQRLRVLNRVLRHDLRNDANVVLGYADLLVESDLPEPARDRAATIRRKATRLVELGERARAVDRTLHAAAGDRHSVALDELVRRVAERIREAYDCRIEVRCPDDVTVMGTDLLESAVMELVANGVEHNDTAEPWVRVSVSVADEWVYVTVADDGPGIPEAERAVLDRGTETALQHGSGLGLWLVTWIVDAVDGDVSFAERTPRGSEVTLRLVPDDD